MRIKTGDMVEIVTGSDRGHRGKVLSIDREKNRVVVEGASQVYKHVRRSQRNPQGGRLSKEMPLPMARVMLVCDDCGSATRLGAKFQDDGAKVRYCKKCGATIGQISPPKNKRANA
jgi:large subunit ribosomal protein L24